MAGTPECAVAEVMRMKGCAWAGCTLLLVWASGSQASLNSARPDATLGERVAATCNARVVEHADWGDIAAVVQSARLCRWRGDGRQWSERADLRRRRPGSAWQRPVDGNPRRAGAGGKTP